MKLNFYSHASNENVLCTLLGIEPESDKPIIAKTDNGAFTFIQDHVKPCLRSLSTMTQKEKKVYDEISHHLCGEITAKTMIHFLNAHHLDYNNLIEKGLALEAPEGMYKTKTE